MFLACLKKCKAARRSKRAAISKAEILMQRRREIKTFSYKKISGAKKRTYFTCVEIIAFGLYYLKGENKTEGRKQAEQKHRPCIS